MLVHNIRRIFVQKVVHWNGLTGDGCMQRLWPENKSAALMKDLVRKFTIPDDLVLDAFAVTFRIPRRRLWLENHRRFVGCNMKSDCAEKFMEAPVELQACQQVRDRPELKGAQELIEDAPLCLSRMRTLRLRMQMDSWELHMLFFLYRRFKNMWGRINARCIQTTACSLSRGRFGKPAGFRRGEQGCIAWMS